MINPNIFKRLGIYIYERFNLFLYTVLIIAMFLSGIVLAKTTYSLSLLPLLLVLFLYFLRIRIYDDLKDHKIDIELKPHRPLPRGLLTRKEILTISYFILIFELMIIFFINIKLVIPYLLVILFSLITFAEFFIGSLLRKNILLYALPHVLLMSTIGMFLYYSINILSLSSLKLNILFLFGLICYLSGLLFELSRKMPGVYEKKSRNESFISLLGFIPSWSLFIAIFIISLFLVSLFLFFSIEIFIINFILSVAFVSVFIFGIDLFKKLSQEGSEFLGGIFILYIFIEIIIGGLL